MPQNLRRWHAACRAGSLFSMRRDSRVRRATLWLATLGYALVASGLPIPLGVDRGPRSAAAEKRLAGKDRSLPFPCMDKPCGCATAEQCFSNCCCNTPAELLAWAKANRVEPGVIAALAGRVAATTPVGESCCSAKQKTCCSASAAPVVAVQHDTHATDDAAKSVSLRAMRACQGMAAEWLLPGISLPPLSVAAIRLVTGPGASIRLVDLSSFGALPAPDGPPPRAA